MHTRTRRQMDSSPPPRPTPGCVVMPLLKIWIPCVPGVSLKFTFDLSSLSSFLTKDSH